MSKKLKGKTESGFDFEIDAKIADDYEMVESLVAIDKGEYGELITVIDKILGEEQRQRLKEHLRDENGKVSLKAMVKEMRDILSEAGEQTKN
jgi:hypothetical protein